MKKILKSKNYPLKFRLDNEISKLLEDNNENEKEKNIYQLSDDDFNEPLSIWELKKKDNSSLFTEKLEKLVKKDINKSDDLKKLYSINTDLHNTSSSSTQADLMSRSKNITPSSQNIRISPHFQNVNILQNFNNNNFNNFHNIQVTIFFNFSTL